MLPPGRRIRRTEDFRLAVRSGVRSGRPRLVVHLALGQDGPASAGFVVSRHLGGAVVRNRVKRRLRHLVADRLPDLPDGARVVVRALPPAADSSSALLGSDLDHAMAAALRRARSGHASTPSTPVTPLTPLTPPAPPSEGRTRAQEVKR